MDPLTLIQDSSWIGVNPSLHWTDDKRALNYRPQHEEFNLALTSHIFTEREREKKRGLNASEHLIIFLCDKCIPSKCNKKKGQLHRNK